MAILNTDQYTQYNIRNVSQKEIYDSYMGILRISPNSVQGKNVDDPSVILNVLVDFDGLFGDKNEQTKITLSDSDGNVLPLYFVPKTFQTVVNINKDGQYIDTKSIINLVSKIDGYTYVSKGLTSRSTILLSDPKDKYSELVIAGGCDLLSNDSSISAEKILVYPIEAPNDDKFFNNKNHLNLFDQNNTHESRAEQMEKNLRAKRQYWYEAPNPNDASEKLTQSEHHVQINGKYITYINDHNEDIPVLYTRDYVLGHYDGHTLSGIPQSTRTMVDKWVKSGTNLVLDDNVGQITKLSWLRVDDITWQMLDQILRGKERHTEGRYRQLGINGNSNIEEALFGARNMDAHYTPTAPILGQGFQHGITTYHAMPFSRYWFHRCRQVAHNMKYWEEQTGKQDWRQYQGTYTDEISAIQNAVLNQEITACCDATVSPVHSLVKDFVLCDGKEITFTNYPNLSLKNENIFTNASSGNDTIVYTKLKGGKVKAFNNKFYEIESNTKSGVHRYISTTPELFVFHEKYPRFIRALNWSTAATTYDENGNITSQNGLDWEVISEQADADIQIMNDTYQSNLSTNNTNSYIHSPNMQGVIVDGEYDEKYNKDYYGKNGIDIRKNITEPKIYPYSFEWTCEYIPHRHKLFSNISGGQGGDDLSKKIVQWFYASSKATVFDAENCLWENPYDYHLSRGMNWANYSFRNNITYFDNYTPVPNAGIMLFNSHIYNPFRDSTGYQSVGGPEFRGTIGQYEVNGWSSSGYVYYDATGMPHAFSNKFNFQSNPVDPNSGSDVINSASVDKNLRRHKIEKFIRRQLAMKINESQARLPISHEGKAQFANWSHHITFWYKKPSKWKKFLKALAAVVLFAAALVLSVVTCGLVLGLVLGLTLGGVVTGAVMKACGWGGNLFGYGLSGFLAGGIGIAIYTYNHPKGKGWHSENCYSGRSDIGHYKIGSFGNGNKSYEPETRGTYSWQCLTSLPYTDTQYLGVGNIEEMSIYGRPSFSNNHLDQYKNVEFDEGAKYYIAHNVMDKWNAFRASGKDPQLNSEGVHEQYNYEYKRQQHHVPVTYNGTQEYINNDGPYPSYMNLIPIIRI